MMTLKILMTIAVAIVLVSCVWSGVVAIRKFYPEHRYVRLAFCLVCYLVIIILMLVQWCRVALS